MLYHTLLLHVSVASATIIRVSHTSTNSIQITTQNVQLKPPDVTVNILSAPCGHKMSNCFDVKRDKIGCVYVAS